MKRRKSLRKVAATLWSIDGGAIDCREGGRSNICGKSDEQGAREVGAETTGLVVERSGKDS